MNRIFNPKQFFIFLIVAFLCIISSKVHAQIGDRIFKKDSTELLGTVLTLKGDSISYWLNNQPKDSIYSIAKTDIDKIIAKNGLVLYFSKRAQDSADAKKSMSRVYCDASVGLGAGYLVDINAGYRFNEKHALGASMIYWGRGVFNTTEANGVGIQWRFTPNRKALMKLEIGYVLKANYADDATSYNTSFNRKASNKVYQRVSIANHFGIGTLGITFAVATGQVNNEFEVITNKFIRTSNFAVNSVVINLGIATPKFYKRK